MTLIIYRNLFHKCNKHTIYIFVENIITFITNIIILTDDYWNHYIYILKVYACMDVQHCKISKKLIYMLRILHFSYMPTGNVYWMLIFILLHANVYINKTIYAIYAL